MEGNKRVSIIDVAKKAGVSIATVSRVIPAEQAIFPSGVQFQ